MTTSEYTWHAPTARLHTSRPRLRPPESGYTYPMWTLNSMGGVPDCIDPGMFVAGKTIAATGCVVTPRWVTKTRVGLPNLALSELTYRNRELLGPPIFGDEARKFARAIQESLGLPLADDPFTDDSLHLQTPQDYEAAQQRSLPPWQHNFTSDDYVGIYLARSHRPLTYFSATPPAS